jgi:hypothetical protein
MNTDCDGKRTKTMAVSKSMKAELCVGPGGMACPCCFPAPGTTTRKKKFKAAKKALKNKSLKDQLTND